MPYSEASFPKFNATLRRQRVLGIRPKSDKEKIHISSERFTDLNKTGYKVASDAGLFVLSVADVFIAGESPVRLGEDDETIVKMVYDHDYVPPRVVAFSIAAFTLQLPASGVDFQLLTRSNINNEQGLQFDPSVLGIVPQVSVSNVVDLNSFRESRSAA